MHLPRLKRFQINIPYISNILPDAYRQPKSPAFALTPWQQREICAYFIPNAAAATVCVEYLFTVEPVVRLIEFTGEPLLLLPLADALDFTTRRCR